jgi:hypothetical protein
MKTRLLLALTLLAATALPAVALVPRNIVVEMGSATW